MTPREEENRKIVSSFWYFFANQDVDNILALLTDDCEFKIGVGRSEGVVPYHGIYRGIEQIRSYLDKAWKGRFRPECMIVVHTGENRPKPIDEDPDPAGLIVTNNVVVGLARIKEVFPDWSPMAEGDIAMVFRINEREDKIFFFQFFTDTAAPMLAFLNRGIV
jgi:ketosteroid isomerase-like protein